MYSVLDFTENLYFKTLYYTLAREKKKAALVMDRADSVSFNERRLRARSMPCPEKDHCNEIGLFIRR